MKTGSLRARVILTTLALLAIVLAGVVTAVTLAYRAKLDGDLHNRLAKAGAAVERAGSAGQAKRLLPGLALEGIAIRIKPPAGSEAPAHRTGQDRLDYPGTRIAAHSRRGPPRRDEGLLQRQPRKHRPRRHQPASRRAPGRGRRARARHPARPPRHSHRSAPPLRRHRDRDAHRPRRLEAPPQAQPHRHRARQPRRTHSTRWSTPSRRPSRKHAPATPQPAASSPTPRTSSAPLSPHSRQASRRFCASNRNGPSATASKQPSPARANDSAASSTTYLDSPASKHTQPEHPIDLATIARPLVEDAHARAPGAAITLSADNDTTVSGDPDALERVLRNLIDNALAAIQPTGLIDVQLQRLQRIRPGARRR